MDEMIEQFDIRNFLNQLEPAKEKNKYICPVCNRHNLGIELNSGKFQCFNGCSSRDIREAIKPWTQVIEEKRQQRQQSSVSAKNSSAAPKTYKVHSKPVPLPKGELALARLAETPIDIPQAIKPQFTPKSVRERLLNQGVIEEELKQITVTTYDYGDNRASHRYQCPCKASKKGHEKTFAVNRIDKSGKTQWNKGNYAWKAYRQDEAITSVTAISDDKIPVLLSHEGEKSVEFGRTEKFAGITFLGNASEEDLVCIFNEIKFKLGNHSFILAHCEDNDDTGVKKAQKLAKAAVRSQVAFVIIDLKNIKPDLCEKGDIVDILASGMTGDELAAAILEEIERIRTEQAGDDSGDSGYFGTDILNPDVTFTQKALNFLYGDRPWICADNKLYRWEGKHYKHSPDAVERPKIASFCNSYAVAVSNAITYPYAKPAKVEEVLKWVKMRFEVDPSLLNPPGLNCTNGVLQMQWEGPTPSWKRIDHTPTLYYTYEPVVTYDPKADPTDCDRLLEVLDKPQQEIFLRIIAASLDLKTVRRYKGRLVRGLLLKGDGNNGKDTLREVVTAMYGYQGMTGCTLSDFKAYDDGRKFPLSRLKNSRVNWATENANTAALDKLQSVKAFLTGDILSAEGKGKDELDYTPNAVGLFNVNDTPNLTGTLEAIASRWGVLSFTKTFKIGADPTKGEIEADARFKYDSEFLRSQVLPAFLNRVLQALVDLMRDGIDYSCTKQAIEDIQRENSHLFQFCQDVGLGYDPNSTLLASDIWNLLEQWYQDNGTLSYEEGSNGKRKAVWNEQPRKSDLNIKAVNQVINRFRVLFPKAKIVAVGKQGGGKPRMGLQGIGVIIPPTTSPNSPPHITQFSPNAAPKEALRGKAFHPSHPNSNICGEKNEIEANNSTHQPITSLQSQSETQKLGNLGEKVDIVSTLGCCTGCNLGDETSKLGDVRDDKPSNEFPAHTPVITPGMRVRVVMPGSKRNGSTGTVRTVREGMAKVFLDDPALGNLRWFECLLPGTDMQKLEVI